jgi:hypothetical protein
MVLFSPGEQQWWTPESQSEGKGILMDLDDMMSLTQGDDLFATDDVGNDLISALIWGDATPEPGESSTTQAIPPPCQVESIELDILAIILALDE